MLRRWYKFILSLIMLLLCTGCSFSQNQSDFDSSNPSKVINNAENNSNINGGTVTYQVEKSNLDLSDNNFAAYTKKDGTLYILGYIGDFETKKFNYSLMSLNEEKRMEEVTSITGIPNYLVMDITSDSNQNFWGLASDIQNQSDLQGESKSIHFIKFDRSGNVLYDQPMQELANSAQSVTYSDLLSDYQGTLFLMEKNQQGENRILLFGEDGTLKKEIPVSKQMIGLISVDDNTVYTYELGSGGAIQIYKVQTEAGTIEAVGNDFNIAGVNYLFGGMNGEILAVTERDLWSCALDGSEPVKLFEWTDKGIDITKWMNFITLSNGTMIGISRGGEEQELLQVIEEQRDPNEEVKTLTVASLQADDKLKQEIIVFNQNHSQYVLKLKEYYTPYASGAAIEDAVDRLNTDLLSGNAGDFIDMKSLSKVTPAKFYVKRGMLENLYTWMENDSGINQDLYTKEVWKANEIEGGLYSLIPSFSLNTMMGRTSQVGEGMTWTPQRMKEVLEKYKVPLYSLETKKSFLEYVCQYNMDEFVDWKNGTCDFSKEDFSIFLEYAKSLPESINEEEIDHWNELYLKKALLHDELNIDVTLMNYLIAKSTFGEDVSLIGFPGREGDGCLIDPGISLAISSKSSQKEDAWEAIRYFLSEDYQYNLVDRSQRSDLPVMEQARSYGYEIVMKDEAQAKSTIGNEGGGWTVEIGYPTKQDIDYIENLIHSTTKIKELDQTIYNIIMEEASAYFSSQRERKEVVDLIQNRVSIYVKENQ